jgi:hypothetical protein
MARPNRNQGRRGRNLDQLGRKIKEDKNYRKRLLGDYEFARRELSEAGLEIDPELHRQIVSSYKTLDDAARRIASRERELPAPDGVIVEIGVNY